MNLWYKIQHYTTRKIVKYGLVIVGVLGVALLLGWVFFQFNIFVYAQTIYNLIFNNQYVFGSTHFGYSGKNSFQWITEELLTGPRATWRLVPILAIPGLLLAIQLKQKGWLLLPVPVFYLLMVSLFTVRFSHWLVPVLPFLALLAALTLEWIYEKISQRKIIKKRMLVVLFALIIILIPLASVRDSIIFSYYGSQTDVRQTAEEWMRTNLSPDSKIVIDLWGPYLNSDEYNVVYIDSIGSADLQTYRDEDVDYLVLNSFNLARIISAASDPKTAEEADKQRERLQQMMSELPLKQKIVGPALFTPPVVEILIYEVQ